MSYGDTFQPAGAQREVKVRGPLWVGAWSLVTFGIYGIWWFYVTAKDLSEYGKAKGYDLGQNPMMSLMALLFGWILLAIPTIIAVYRFTKRVQQAQRIAGAPDQLNGWLALILILVFSPAYDAYVQAELNKAWAAEGGPVPDADASMPAQLDTGPSGTATAASSAPAAEPAMGAPTSSPEPPNPERPPGA